jgi:hypothetical protein
MFNMRGACTAASGAVCQHMCLAAVDNVAAASRLLLSMQLLSHPSAAVAPAHAALGAGSGSVVLPGAHAWQNDLSRAPPGEMLPGEHCWQATRSTLLPLANLLGTVV